MGNEMSGKKLSKEGIIERLRSSGLRLNPEQTGNNFQFTISGKYSQDVFSETRKLALEFQKQIVIQLNTIQISSPARGVVLFPTLLNPSIPSMPDYVTHKKDGTVHVAVNISYARWIASSLPEKIDILAENIKSSLKRIKNTYLSTDDRQVILGVVEKTGQILKKKCI